MSTKLTLFFIVVLLSGCTTTRAQKEIDALQKEWVVNTVAWYQARETLRGICSEKPNTCAPRLIKMSNEPSVNDWQSVLLPPYETIVSVHESILRDARGSLRFYEDAMFALSHALARRVDAGEITQEQFRAAFNRGWEWMGAQLQNDYTLTRRNVDLAREADAKTWQTISNVVVGLAVVAGALLVVDATIRAENYRAAAAAQPAPSQSRSLTCFPSNAGGAIVIHCS